MRLLSQLREDSRRDEPVAIRHTAALLVCCYAVSETVMVWKDEVRTIVAVTAAHGHIAAPNECHAKRTAFLQHKCRS